MVDINMKWVERLHAPRYIWSQISALNPQRGILCREERSQQQLLTWDVDTGETQPLTLPVDYTLNATLSPDGEFVTYLVPHPTHADVYQYVRVPYEGGEAQPIALTALMNASPHIEEASGRIGFTAVTGNGYSVQVWTPDGKKPLFSYESDVLAYGPSLSFDGKIAVVATMQSAESETTYLEAYDIDTGAKISQLALPDTPLEAVKFAPVKGDTRLLVQAREGLLNRPLVWDVKTEKVVRLENKPFRDRNFVAWDWLDENTILMCGVEFGCFQFLIYDVLHNQPRPLYTGHEIYLAFGTLLLAYSVSSHIIFHYETLKSSYAGKVVTDSKYVEAAPIPKPLFPIDNALALTKETREPLSGQVSDSPVRHTSVQVVSVVFDEITPYVEFRAWKSQNLSHSPLRVWELQTDGLISTDAVSKIRNWKRHSPFKQRQYDSKQPVLLTAHNMAAAFALVALHQDPSLWVGGVVVRPILDWVALYESVAPPEKAMMRLWFGGSPTERPDAWRDASPLRQTKPLTVPVKLLYHPYDSLTPIQHIQTYAANNPMVELIDISRDLVGPAHEQQERLITRMLEAGLPLLQQGT